GAIRFSAPKKGLEMACLPSFAAAMAMTCAEVTTPWPPRPDIRMLIRRLIMVDLLMAPSELRLRQRFLGGCLPRLLLLSQIGEERLRLVGDVLLIDTAGLLGDLGQAHFVKLLTHWRHLRHEPLLHQATLLTAGVGIEFVVEADGREFLLAEPGLQRVVQSDVHRGSVSGQHHDILD